jgi:hypothetical protein
VTFRAYLDGVEIDASRILLPVDQGFTENADGTAARAGVLFDDPLGDFNPRAWGLLEVEEDDCPQPRIWTGWIISRRISRGPYRDGAGRIWDTDIIDLNELLHFTALQKNRDDAMRPRETGTARLNWLMGTLGMDGIVFDNGFVMANAWIYDETDYRGQYADEVLRDIVSASGVGRWTDYLYWDADAPAGEEVSLFYNDVGDAVRDSTLRLSNVIADVDDVTTFYPSLDASMERDPESQYGGVYVTFVGGRIYRTDSTTITTMDIRSPNGVLLIRDGTYTSERLINAETANRHAATYLDWHSGEIDTIDVSVQLPADKVNLIGAGMRLEVKFTHLPDHDSFTWTRVASRTITGLSADRSMYTVRLRLTFKGVLQSGGGDPGGLPLPSACTAGTAEQVWGESFALGGGVEITTFTSAATPVAGNTRFVYAHRRGSVAIDPPVGFTDCGAGAVHPAEEYGAAFYRINQAGDSATITWAGGTDGPHLIYVEERAGQLTPDTTSLVSTDPYLTGSPFPGAAITPDAGRLGAIVGYWFAKRNHGALAADTGWTLLDAATTDSVTTHAVIEKVVSSTSGTYTPSFTGANPAVFDNHSYGAITLALLCANTDNPPAPGQWVFWELVTMTGDTGTTAFPYAAGSLHVYVDGVPISPAGFTETDPSTGEFTLAWEPDADETVRVDYQGI